MHSQLSQTISSILDRDFYPGDYRKRESNNVYCHERISYIKSAKSQKTKDLLFKRQLVVGFLYLGGIGTLRNPISLMNKQKKVNEQVKWRKRSQGNSIAGRRSKVYTPQEIVTVVLVTVDRNRGLNEEGDHDNQCGHTPADRS